jgi:hypothetical protein
MLSHGPRSVAHEPSPAFRSTRCKSGG